MSEVNRKAQDAKRLLNDPTFKEILKDLSDNAISVFSRPNSGEAEIMAAHEKIRAVETVRMGLQRWIDDKDMADKAKERSAP